MVIQPDEIESIADDRRGARKLVRNIDYFVAEAPLMPTIGKRLGVFLGPPGKMPRPLPPGSDPSGIVASLRRTVRVRSRDKTTIHVPVGSSKMSAEDITANIVEVIRRIESKTPRGPGNIASVYVKTTMGPSVKVT
jgi:large subunit ribosomal protein L1